jgi:alpha-beta hydrolase superfamily lysophospholipase
MVLPAHHEWTSPAGRVRGTVVVAHGVHQHSGLYAPFAARLAEAGFASLRLDFAGFGHRREEDAPMVGDFDVYVQDLADAVRAAASREPRAPIFVFGHSLGGLVATLLAVQALGPARNSPLAGVHVQGWIMSSPSLVVPLLQQCVAPLVAWLPAGLVLQSFNLDGASGNEEFKRAWESDVTLVKPGRPFEAGYAAGGVQAMARARGELSRLARDFPDCSMMTGCRMLVLHGEADHAHDHGSCAFLAAAVPGAELRSYPDLKHELLFEAGSFAAGNNQVADDLVAWLLAETK